MVTVYTQPACVKCKLTKMKLDQLGVGYTEVDLREDQEALTYVLSLGHKEAPVVETAIGSWSGYRPARIEALI